MNDELVTIASFNDTVEAAMARNCLEAGGVPAFLRDEHTVGTDWGLSYAVGGIKLVVHEADRRRAEFLLTTRLPAEADESEPIGPGLAPETAEELRAEQERTAPKNQTVDRLFRITIFGLVFWPLQFYALWVLMSLNLIEGTLSRNWRWKVWASVLLNIPLMSLGLIPLGWVATQHAGDWQRLAWKRWDFPEEGFAVRMPGRPEFEVRHLDSRFGPVECTTHFVNEKAASYQVRVYRYRKAAGALDPAELLAEAVPAIIASWDMRELTHAPVEIGGRAGQEWALQARAPADIQMGRGRQTFVRARFCVDHNRLYAVLVEWPQNAIAPPVASFLDSFALH